MTTPVGPKVGPIRVFLAGHIDNQASPKVDLGRVVLAGWKVSQPGSIENLGQTYKPLEQENVEGYPTHRTEMEKHRYGYHLVHNGKNKDGWDLGRTDQPRILMVVTSTDTPQGRCSLE